MKLYEISDAIEYILAREVDQLTGEIDDNTIAKLDELDMWRDAKLLALAAYAKGELAEAEAVKAERLKLTKREAGHTRRAERILEYMRQNFPKDAAKISDARSVIQWRKNPAAVELDEKVELPEKYLRVVPETTAPDKKAIGDALKAGIEIEGARLVQGSRLEIK